MALYWNAETVTFTANGGKSVSSTTTMQPRDRVCTAPEFQSNYSWSTYIFSEMKMFLTDNVYVDSDGYYIVVHALHQIKGYDYSLCSGLSGDGYSVYSTFDGTVFGKIVTVTIYKNASWPFTGVKEFTVGVDNFSYE